MGQLGETRHSKIKKMPAAGLAVAAAGSAHILQGGQVAKAFRQCSSGRERPRNPAQRVTRSCTVTRGRLWLLRGRATASCGERAHARYTRQPSGITPDAPRARERRRARATREQRPVGGRPPPGVPQVDRCAAVFRQKVLRRVTAGRHKVRAWRRRARWGAGRRLRRRSGRARWAWRAGRAGWRRRRRWWRWRRARGQARHARGRAERRPPARSAHRARTQDVSGQ